LWRRRLTRPARQGGGGGGGGKRGSVRVGGGKSDERVLDRTPLAPGEAGAEIVRATNPWTRSGPSDDHERLLRNVKRRADADLRAGWLAHAGASRFSQRAEQDNARKV